MGAKKTTTKVRTQDPSPQEQRHWDTLEAINQRNIYEQGYEMVDGQLQPRALTPEEQQQKDRDAQLMDLAYKKMTGQISDEDRALVEQEYGAAMEVGKSNIQSEFQRQLDALNLGESRGYEDIQQQLMRGTEDITKAYATDAQERGLQGTDTPILGERAKSFQRFGQDVSMLGQRHSEDVNRNKRLLSEDALRNVTNLETSMGGAKAGALLDTGYRQQLFAQGMREFQAQLQQNAVANRQMIANSFQSTALGLGVLRSRNYTSTTTAPKPSPIGIIGGVIGGAMQGFSMGGPWGALAGGIGGGLSGAAKSGY